MTTTLALDTSTPSPSLAIVDGDAVIAERTLEPAVGAGRRIAQEIHLLLGAADLTFAGIDRLVVGVGPGGFTGLRIGIATALALGQARSLPVQGVVSLETLALGMARHASEGALLVPVIDAKRAEVFTGAYRTDGSGALRQVAAPRAATGDAFVAYLDAVAAEHPGTGLAIAGDGVHRIADRIGKNATVLTDPTAHAIRAALSVAHVDRGAGCPVAPLYLRLPDAEVNRLARERAVA